MMSPADRRGRFIVLEGIDGSGTTTHAKRLTKALKKVKGIDARLTAEPTGGPIGGLVRQVLQSRLVVADASSGPRPFAWSTMALLFAADRLDHLDSVVVPSLRDGATVVSDRYVLSSLAYQSVTAPEGSKVIPWIRQINANAIRPDLWIILGIAPEVAEERRANRGESQEIFERLEIQRRLARVYEDASTLLEGDRVVHVSADGTIDEVGNRILEAALTAY